jgi:cyclopropane fatty-acyl-phospholipid synthase-like methyltransferase
LRLVFSSGGAARRSNSSLYEQAIIMQSRFLRSSKYDTAWMIETAMGPNVLWLAEWLTEAVELKPRMRVLDLGCGMAASSIFLAKEFGVNVAATDLWVRPTENQKRIDAAKLSHLITPLHVEAHAMPFAENAFDAILSFDGYHYFGTDDLYLGYVTKFLKPDGVLGIVVPGVVHELNGEVPEHARAFWDWEFCSFHSADWWRRHWAKTGLVQVERSDGLEDGWKFWRDWNVTCAEVYEGERREGCLNEAKMLKIDNGRTFGFVRTTGRKPQ